MYAYEKKISGNINNYPCEQDDGKKSDFYFTFLNTGKGVGGRRGGIGSNHSPCVTYVTYTLKKKMV